MRSHKIRLLALAGLAICASACAKRQPNDAEIAAVAAKLSNSISVDEYAKCAAAYGQAYGVAKEQDAKAANKAALTSTIYFTKMQQLSSNEIAAQKMTDASKQYWQIKQQKGEIVYLQILEEDVKHCQGISSSSLKK